MKTRYFDHINELDALKQEYKRLVKLNHPDVGGDTATMQKINAQYSEAVKRLVKSDKRAAQEIPEDYINAVSAIQWRGGIQHRAIVTIC